MGTLHTKVPTQFTALSHTLMVMVYGFCSRITSYITMIRTCTLSQHINPASSWYRYVRPLEEAHDAEHLALFEELLEAAVDLDRIPDEYLIAASYDPELGDLAAAKADAEAAIDRAAQGVERERCFH